MTPPSLSSPYGDRDCLNDIRIANINLAEKWKAQLYDMATDLGIVDSNISEWFSDSIHPISDESRGMIADRVAKWFKGGIPTVASSGVGGSDGNIQYNNSSTRPSRAGS